MSLIPLFARVVGAFARDKMSGAICSVDTVHAAIHAGIAFRATHKGTVSNGASLDLKVVVPVGRELHLTPICQMDGTKGDVIVYSGTITWSGSPATSVPVRCRHLGDLAKVSGVVITVDTATVTNATLQHRDYIGSATGNQVSRDEIVLPAGTYAIRYTNGQATGQDVNLGASWYEEIEDDTLIY